MRRFILCGVLAHAVAGALAASAITSVAEDAILVKASTVTAADARAAKDAYDAAIDLERRGKLSDALATLRATKLTGFRAKHRIRLAHALRTFGAASVYSQLGELVQARTLLEALLPTLDPVRDVFVERAVYRRLAVLDRRRRATADAQAGELMEKGTELSSKRKFTEAAAAFKAVAELPAAEVSPRLRDRARLEQIRAETRAATTSDQPSFWDDVGSTLLAVIQEIIKWAAILAAFLTTFALLAFARAYFRKRLRVRGKTTISVTDLSAESRERNSKSHVLTRELVDQVYSATGGSETDGSAEIDERRDLDGTALPLIRLGEGSELIDSLIYEETPVKLGPVALSPRQLVYFIRWYFGRGGDYEIRGSLRTDGTLTALTVERFAVENGSQPTNRWHAVYDGNGSRSKAITDVATRIAVDLGGSYVSTNWRSFREYRDALVRMGTMSTADDPEKELEAARSSLHKALEHDPMNLLARFNLGSVQRMLGRNNEAVANFRLLEGLVADVGRASSTAKTFVERHPELLYVAQYNRAVALSKIPRWECQHEARQALALLVATLDTNKEILAVDESDTQEIQQLVDRPHRPNAVEPDHLDATDRDRLNVLARAAWASTLVFLAEHAEERGIDSATLRARHRQERLLEAVASVRAWLAHRSASGTENPRLATAAHQAQATVDNAYGRILSILDRQAEARDAVQAALVRLPDFGDAYVNMASILMTKRLRTRGWQADAEYHLNRALQISPRDEKALVLLGDLYADAAVERYDEAEATYRRILTDARASFNLGDLLARTGRHAEAVEMFARSLHQQPSVDYRALRYVEAVLKLAGQNAASREHLREAHSVARRLAHRGTPPRLRTQGAKLVEQVERAAARQRRTTQSEREPGSSRRSGRIENANSSPG